jgi:hypothetical protein
MEGSSIQAGQPSPASGSKGRDRLLPIALSAAVAILALASSLYAAVFALKGRWDIRTQFNTKDLIVYAAWMRQAQDGAIPLDNRFAADP